jgi:hypothetical protein
MKRREFIRPVGGAAPAAGRARAAQSACSWPHAQDNPVGPPRIAALLQELELLDRLPERGD